MGHAGALGGLLDVRVQVSSYAAIVKLVASGAGLASSRARPSRKACPPTSSC